MNFWARVIDANNVQLHLLAGKFPEDSPVEFYRRIRVLYLEGRAQEMQETITANPPVQDQCSLVSDFAAARLAIRSGSAFDTSRLEIIQSDMALDSERLNLLAMLSEGAGDDHRARQYYLAAYGRAEQAGMSNRMCAMFHNSVAALSRIHPERRLLPEYMAALQLARRAHDETMEGAILNNIGREFELMGAQHLALQHYHSAVAKLRLSAYGGYQFGMALLQRAALFAKLDKREALADDLEELRLIDIAEVKEGLGVLEVKIGAATMLDQHRESSRLSSNWRKRLRGVYDHLENTSLTDTEEQIIEKLFSGITSRERLIKEIYGKNADRLTNVEARLKQAIYRIRRKIPGLIETKGQCYVISDNAYYET